MFIQRPTFINLVSILCKYCRNFAYNDCFCYQNAGFTTVLTGYPGINAKTSLFTSKYSLCFVWFIPAETNSLLKSIITLPDMDTSIGILGPLPFKISVPVNVPSGILVFVPP